MNKEEQVQTQKLQTLDSRSRGDSQKVRAFREFMEASLIGQPQATDALCRVLTDALNQLRNREAPVGVLFFSGESGLGKSLAVKLLARFCHGRSDALTCVSGGEMQEKHEISKLTGTTPGYSGFDDPDKPQTALFSNDRLRAARAGSSFPVELDVILIDEAEKAHDAVFDLLLRPCDDGTIGLGNGTTGNLRNSVIAMTSNLGLKEVLDAQLGFIQRELTHKDVSVSVRKAMLKRFRQEFLRRIDEVVVFKALTPEEKLQVVRADVRRIQERIMGLEKTKFQLDVDQPALGFILAQSGSTGGGVRGLKPAIKTHLERRLGLELSHGAIKDKDRVVVTHRDGNNELSFFLERRGGRDFVAGYFPPVKRWKLTLRHRHVETFDKRYELLNDLFPEIGVEERNYEYRVESPPFCYTSTFEATAQQVDLLVQRVEGLRVVEVEAKPRVKPRSKSKSSPKRPAHAS